MTVIGDTEFESAGVIDALRDPHERRTSHPHSTRHARARVMQVEWE